MSSKKERNHYDLKEMENIKYAQIVMFDWNVYYYRKISSFVQKSQIFDEPQPK